MADLDAIRDALAENVDAFACDLLGKPTARTRSELRWGNHGSLSLVIAGPKRGVWIDFSAGVGGRLLDLVMHVHGVSLSEAVAYAEDWLGGHRTHAAPRPVMASVETDAAKVAAARRIWDAGRDPRGSLVERYLVEHRGLTLPDEIAGSVIRFGPSVARKVGDTIECGPAMLAAMRNVRTGEITAVHRTWLGPDGSKIEKRMRGVSGGAAVMLTPFDEVTHGLFVGEGIETCLTAYLGDLRPVWAMGSAGAIGDLPALAGIECLTILGETDKANRDACERCGERWFSAGAEVRIIEPKFGGDLNDLVRRAA